MQLCPVDSSKGKHTIWYYTVKWEDWYQFPLLYKTSATENLALTLTGMVFSLHIISFSQVGWLFQDVQFCVYKPDNQMTPGPFLCPTAIHQEIIWELTMKNKDSSWANK